MKQNLTLEALRQLLERRDMCALRDALTQTHPADLAELLDELDRPEMCIRDRGFGHRTQVKANPM